MACNRQVDSGHVMALLLREGSCCNGRSRDNSCSGETPSFPPYSGTFTLTHYTLTNCQCYGCCKEERRQPTAVNIQHYAAVVRPTRALCLFLDSSTVMELETRYDAKVGGGKWY